MPSISHGLEPRRLEHDDPSRVVEVVAEKRLERAPDEVESIGSFEVWVAITLVDARPAAAYNEALAAFVEHLRR